MYILINIDYMYFLGSDTSLLIADLVMLTQ